MSATSPRAQVDTLASFLPSLAVEHVRRHARTCGAYELRGAVVLADIAGFTALTERLAAHGPEGAEALTRHLNEVFGELTERVAARGGDTVKFAGDALLALWRPGAEQGLAESVAMAARCAREIQERVRESRVAQALGLSLRLAVGAGTVVVATLGGVRDRWEMLVAGEALAQVGRASPQAPPGGVLLSPEAAACLAGADTRAHAGGALLLGLAGTAPASTGTPPIELGDELVPALRALIPSAIRRPLDAGLSEWIGELRQLTTLFVGLPELTLLASSALDRAQAAFVAVQQALYRYEGSINKLNADDKGVSLLAVLGLPPLAHDDDAERGVRAACEVQRELARLGLPCAIGVASGLAFCGAVGGTRRREYTIMGDVVNLAARLMGAATDRIYCDAATAQRAGARLRFEALAPIPLKGKRDPVALYRPVEAAGGPRGAAARPAAALVGRARELRRVEAWIARLASGAAVRACILGQAGSGKSALVAQALERAQERGVRTLRTAADAYERATPYLAWRALLGELLELGAAPLEPEARRAHVRARLSDPKLESDLHLLAALVPIETAAREDADEDPRERARRTRALACRIVAHGCAAQPLAIAIEDAQWLDAASRALLLDVAREVPRAALLLSARLEEEGHADALETLRGAGALEVLELRELGRRAVLQLVRERLQVRSLPRALADSLCARAGGNPLFAETLAWALRDSGSVDVTDGRCRLRASGSAESGELPHTLQAALMRRMDRLDADVQLTLKLASVIGQELDLAALRAIHPLRPSERELATHCELLERFDWIARGAARREAAPQAERWRFRSGVAREVAYARMLFAQRRQLHRQLAAWYEASAEPVPLALLAHHWRCAADGAEPEPALLERAADALAAAAQQAARSDANLDAMRLYGQALECARRLPSGEPTARRELDLLLALGLPLVRATSWASAEVGRTYRRAAELSAQVGDALQRFQALRGVWQFHTGQGEYARARELGDELLEVAARSNRAALLLETHRMLGNTAFWSGDLAQARERLEAAVELAALDATERPLLSAYGQDPEVANRGILAWTLGFLGRPDEALTHAERAVKRAEALEHPFTLAFAFGSCMWTHAFLRRPADAEEWARRTLELSRQRGFAYLEAAAGVVHGWARTALGDARAGLREIERALARWRASGQTIGLLAFTLMQADACLRAERVDEARAALADPLLAGRGAAEGWLEPLLRCLHAEILHAAGDPEAQCALREVIDCARARGDALIAERASARLGGR